MASFMANLFPLRDSKHEATQLPPLVTRSNQKDNFTDSPSTPSRSSFITPVHTPQGSPSKSRNPPGAHDLPVAFENAMKLSANHFGSPTKTSRQNVVGTPLSPGKNSTITIDDSYFGNSVMNPDDSIIHKSAASPGSPLKKQGKENATPTSHLTVEQTAPQNQAALSRQEIYHAKDQQSPTSRKYNTQRGLTSEELQILQKPNVKRLANVTQLYFLDYYFDLLTYVGARQTRLNHFKAEFPAPPETPQDTYRPLWKRYTGRERANLRKRRVRLRHGDFQILTQVGQGGYGQVFLAQKKDTREVCALKVMSKKLIFKLDEIRHVLTERDILTNSKSEWLVRLLYSFQDETSIYLAMEYVPGGDFRTLLNNTGVLANRFARFYIAEMLCSVDALHQLGYIHRDLKPENFLIDASGHVKLTDFGLAAGMLAPGKIESMRIKLEQVGEMSVPFGKPMDQRTIAERIDGYRNMRDKDLNYAKSIVGSPDYMAPEVLKGEEYDFTVDYWSLGCMLFEAVTGFPPFAGATVEETWKNLKHWQKVLVKPTWEDPKYFISDRSWHFITSLIASRSRRFNSIKAVCRHPYFTNVRWDVLRHERAPFVPELNSDTDAGYFDDFGNEADMAKYKEVHDKQTALENMADREDAMSKGLFVGFTFKHRKPIGDDGNSSPRKAIATDGSFGTML